MRWTLLLVLLAACGPRQSAPASESGETVAGTVVSVDTSPLAYDGDALVVVQTEAGETVTVRVPARVNLCEAEGLGLLDDLEASDRIEARGTVNADGDVTPCTEADHYLRLR